ncbi:MAG: hypothetical protein IKS90_04620 [Clostridia bacterium]|nr:hypothetical protein [Clostridia bacterium]
MYGYIRPNIPELKVREKQRYDAWYCGLCRKIGKRYGFVDRMLLSYDSAFLAMLLSSVTGETSPCEKNKCPVRPFGKKKLMIAVNNAALDYAADVCVLLAKFKLDDDVRDGKKLRAAAKLPFLRAFSKAKKRQGELNSLIGAGIEALSEVEKRSEMSEDAAANVFGDIMRGIMEHSPAANNAERRTVLSELGFFIGRIVYFMDAWDDREEDKKRGTYNPFNLTNATLADADYVVNFSINSAISAYNLLDGRAVDSSITDNVFFEGLFAEWDAITKKERYKTEMETTNKERMVNAE